MDRPGAGAAVRSQCMHSVTLLLKSCARSSAVAGDRVCGVAHCSRPGSPFVALPGIEWVITLRMPAAPRGRRQTSPTRAFCRSGAHLTAQSAGGMHPVDRVASIGGSLTALSAGKRTPPSGFVGLVSLCRRFRGSAERAGGRHRKLSASSDRLEMQPYCGRSCSWTASMSTPTTFHSTASRRTAGGS